MREALLTMDFLPRSQPDLAPADLPQLQLPSTEYRHPLAQQVHGPYSVDRVSAFAQQAHRPGGCFATTQNHVPTLSTLSIVLPRHAQYDTELARSGPSGPGFAASAASAAPASSIGPPTQSRKKKAPTLRADAWEPYKARIIELHITQKLPLRKVKETVKEEFG